MTPPQIPDEPPRLDQLLEEAAFWFARMRGPEADAHRPAFEQWLARGAAHLGAYNRAAEIFSLGKFLAEPGESVDVTRSTPPRRRWPLAALLTGSAVALVSGLWVAAPHPPPPPSGASVALVGTAAGKGPPSAPEPVAFTTRAGAGRTLRLADGSRVTLDGDSRLLVSFTSRERALRLARGRGRFDVAHERRPFIVYAGRGSVTAHGTVFDVAIDQRQQVRVRLLRGSVDVALPPSARGAVRRLAPGEEVRFAGATVAALTGAPPGAVAPMRSSMDRVDEFDDVTLSDLVAAANRRGAIPLRLADPALGRLRLSGRFGLDDPQRLAERIAALSDLRVDRSRPDQIILRPR